MDDKRVILNIGGTKFETFKSTLTTRSIYFRAMLSGLYRDDKEDIFIDRDPELFKHLLRFMRDPKYNFPINCFSEMLYFGIESEEEKTETQVIPEKEIKLTTEKYDEIFKAGSNPLIAIAAHGAENKDPTHHTPFFSGNRSVIKPLLCAHSKSIIEIDNDTFTIHREGDLLYSISLQFKIGIPKEALLEKISQLRYQLFDAIEFSWGYNDTFTISSKLLQTYEQLFLSPMQRQFNTKLDATNNIIIKIPLWFVDDPALSLPIIAAVNNITVKIKGLKEIATNPPKMIAEFVFLDLIERQQIFDKPPAYPVKQWQSIIHHFVTKSSQVEMNMNFNHVCDMFVITIEKDGKSVPIETIKMYLNNHLFIDTTGNMQLSEMAYSQMYPDEYIYVLSMKHGTINMSRIDVTSVKLTLKEPIDNAVLHIFARNNNILRFMGGGAFLAYSH